MWVSGETFLISLIIFLCFDEWLEVCFGLIARSPYGDTIDEVWVDMGVVEFGHDFGGDEFIGVSEAVDCGL